MNIFDIMGPIMVGPSSSHTAGAARIGFLTRRLLGSTPRRAELLLHGSFAATGTGHGTDRALVAGLLGMRPDDARLPRSFELAEAAGMELTLGRAALRGAHPNTVLLRVEDAAGKRLEVTASSLGGGRVQVCAIDGLEARFTGELPSLTVRVVGALSSPAPMMETPIAPYVSSLSSPLGRSRSTVPGKGCFVAPQNPELVREDTLRRAEEHLSHAVDVAKAGGVTLAELTETLNLLYGDETL